MEDNTKATGTMVNSTAKEYTVNLMVLSVVENGMTVNALHGLMNFDFCSLKNINLKYKPL